MSFIIILLGRWREIRNSQLNIINYAIVSNVKVCIQNSCIFIAILRRMGEADKAKNYMKLALERPVNTADDLEASDEARLFKGKLR